MRVVISLFLIGLFTTSAFPHGAIVCAHSNKNWKCSVATDEPSPEIASQKAMKLCEQSDKFGCGSAFTFFNQCGAAAAGPTSRIIWEDAFPTETNSSLLVAACNRRDGDCSLLASSCDGLARDTIEKGALNHSALFDFPILSLLIFSFFTTTALAIALILLWRRTCVSPPNTAKKSVEF